MQLLSPTTKSQRSEDCAHLVLDTVPPVIWFIRRNMRAHRKGLSLPQFRTLAAVDREPAVSLSSLADHLGSSLPTVSRIVTGLVKKGLLNRKGCLGDRRQLALAITPRGRAVLLNAWASTQSEMEKRLGGLSAEDRARVGGAMLILRELFGSSNLPQALSPRRHVEASGRALRNGHAEFRHQSRLLATVKRR